MVLDAFGDDEMARAEDGDDGVEPKWLHLGSTSRVTVLITFA